MIKKIIDLFGIYHSSPLEKIQMRLQKNKFRRGLLFILCYFLALFKAEAQVWNDVGGAYGAAYSFHVWQNQLYVGGTIKNPSWSKYISVSKWDGTSWDSLNYGVAGGLTLSLSDYNGEIYAGGSFLAAGHRDSLFPPFNPFTSYVARYDGENWYAVKTGEVPSNNVQILSNKDILYVGGVFHKIGNTVVQGAARWDGTNWNTLGGGVAGGLGGVKAMAIYNDELIISGCFYRAGGDTAIGVARWDGSQWHDMGIGLHGCVDALTVDTVNNILYAGGTFSSTGSVYNPQPTLCNIAQWDEANEKWIAVGNECGSIFWAGITALCMYHGELFAGGYGITGTPSLDTVIAKWNGWEWKPVGQGQIRGNGTPLIVYEDELYVGSINGNATNGDTIIGIGRYYAPPDTTLSANKPLIKQTAWLYDNRPNPSTGTTQIPYYLPQGKTGELFIYDTQGKEIKKFTLQTGNNYVELNTKLWQNGVYINTLVWDGWKKQSKRMVITSP